MTPQQQIDQDVGAILGHARRIAWRLQRSKVNLDAQAVDSIGPGRHTKAGAAFADRVARMLQANVGDLTAAIEKALQTPAEGGKRGT